MASCASGGTKVRFNGAEIPTTQEADKMKAHEWAILIGGIGVLSYGVAKVIADSDKEKGPSSEDALRRACEEGLFEPNHPLCIQYYQ